MTLTVLALVVSGLTLWALVAFVLAAVIGRTVAAGEHQHQMDGLYRSTRWTF